MSLFPLLLWLIVSINGWDLTHYNITQNYYVSSIASYGNRAFLAIPRSSCRNEASSPTLVEVSWFIDHPNVFSRRAFFHEAQQWERCSDLQDAVALDVETFRGKLWTLDRGNVHCDAKIVIFNLFQRSNYSVEIAQDVPKEKLTSLVVDAGRAYVGLQEASFLLVFSFSDFQWTRLNLHAAKLPISTQFLTLSRKEPLLYLTGSDERPIHTIDLETIKQTPIEELEIINATFIGEKLGSSSGLVSDFKDGLIYYLVRDYAIVRWDMRGPSEAEFYNILAQSYELLPMVSQLYTGPQNGIWALVNPGPADKCGEATLEVDRRLVKILKYNAFI